MSSSQDVHTDVCVIGAGPAGLTVARECIGAPFEVLVLESGRYEPDEAAQDLAGSQMESPYYQPHAMAGARRRQFGGTANDWVHVTWPGQSRVYARTLTGEPVDFEAKAWQPDSGWAVGGQELAPYYDRAHHTWAGSVMNDDPAAWSTPSTPVLPVGRLQTRMAQYAPADTFTLLARDQLTAAPNVRVMVGSTVIALDGGRDDDRIHRAVVVRADGSTFSVYAEIFVLAGGGVENSQVLLSSLPFRPGGPGNRHDNVGCWVTDHPELRLGAIEPSSPDVLERVGLYDLHYVGGQMVNGVLSFDQEFKRQEELLNMGAVFVPRRPGFNSTAERALRSLKPLLHGRLVSQPWEKARTLLSRPGETAAVLRTFDRSGPSDWYRSPDAYQWFRGGWSRPEVDRSQFSLLQVHVATEQSPLRENRLTLAAQRDALGRRRLHLKMNWTQSDQRNLLRSMAYFGVAVEKAGLGRFEPWMRFDGPLRPHFGGMHHPMGGTRMHPDPKLGVVDPDSRVHGLRNLYVAGSSVFPTSLGYVNPTLTIVALSTRLADHLRTRLSAALPGTQMPVSPSTRENVMGGW
ncbi:GMC family oxidoreductase [Kineosporia rhizophila]|uniref:GMC oxidoreductase n=1 Tax=Kineosporia TaxID=49184 RepID=UPI001E5432E4|nr:GMC family oxidoreductase [Kineosporia sp. NBRC 101677]MCE0539691.1 GMC family oxidoreductase [Kineosporia rhizophila]GLY16415.1 GMC family oxidoreductase [Kineosporia sp. NBRC 101677]